ncbi:unnamed protein product [Ostreobium quekettii]|uniref:Small ribosomal subunit protein mS29 n=1 Tax=Ostreobium quekettii TaxID=121088 RepID=A0A8S1J9U0_9CHLO|nr:unnamed protein product [Ostreobium quekettii]
MTQRGARSAWTLVWRALEAHKPRLASVGCGAAAGTPAVLAAHPAASAAPWQGAAGISSTPAVAKQRRHPVALTPNTPRSAVSLFVDREEAETMPPFPGDEDVQIPVPVETKVHPSHRRLGHGRHRKEAEEAAELQHVTPGLLALKPSTSLSPADANKYYPFKKDLIPEAFASYYKIEVPEDVGPVLPKGGCKALQEEFQRTGEPAVLARGVFFKLIKTLSLDKCRRLLLDGLAGSGKSMLLAALVEWARSQKWLVLYVPSAFTMTTDMYFFKRPEERCWDTPNCARDLLRSMLDNHGDQLSQLKQEGQPEGEAPDSGFGETLADLCRTGINATLQQPTVTVDATIRLLREFLHGEHNVHKLIVIDDYNALYWHTTYGEWLNTHTRREVTVNHLALAREFRLMGDVPIDMKCQIVAAPTYTGGIGRSAWFPKARILKVPQLSQAEVDRILCFYFNCGVIGPKDSATLELAAKITGGNGHELKKAMDLL